MIPIDDVDLMERELDCEEDLKRYLTEGELKEVILHSRQYGYKPCLNSERYYYGKLKILHREK